MDPFIPWVNLARALDPMVHAIKTCLFRQCLRGRANGNSCASPISTSSPPKLFTHQSSSQSQNHQVVGTQAPARNNLSLHPHLSGAALLCPITQEGACYKYNKRKQEEPSLLSHAMPTTCQRYTPPQTPPSNPLHYNQNNKTEKSNRTSPPDYKKSDIEKGQEKK